ncbi:MAG: OmpA family protein [Gammaproteobacteria bacterium]
MNQVMMAAVTGGALLAASAASAAVPDDYVFIDGFAVSHDERIPDKEIGLGGRLGIGGIVSRGDNTATGFELGIFANPIKSSGRSGDSQTGIMVDLVQFYSLGKWTPYIFGGIGGAHEDVGPARGIFLAIEAGGGLLFNLADQLTARASLAAMSVHQDELYAGTDTFTDFRLNVGLMYPFGGAEEPVAAPAPAVARVTDSDGDGLPDGKDTCPSTPASTADGCPPAAPAVRTDSDSDGVYDDQDECEGTLAGLKVDDKGCAVATEEQTIVLKGVTFLPASATLTPEARVVLDAAVAALSGQASLKVELGGHTDSQGADSANQALSQRRAASARQYLVDKGIDGTRLSAVGYGETQPIADNNTREGRSENRRVELKIVK